MKLVIEDGRLHLFSNAFSTIHGSLHTRLANADCVVLSNPRPTIS